MSLENNLSNIITLEILKNQIINYFDKIIINRISDNILLCPVSPTDVVNIPYDIPSLSDLVEIVPYIKDINTANGVITVGWNFFVEGIHRLDLGTSRFDDFNNLAMTLRNNGRGYQSSVKSKLLVKDIIQFIINIIKKHKIEININAPQMEKTFYSHVGDKFMRSLGGPGAAGKLFTQNKFAN